MKCNKDKECKDKHDVYCTKNKHSTLRIVDEITNCYRHIFMGRPLKKDNNLALLLYTGLA